jgi:para-aminobenzoate synthetase component 1
MLNELFIPKIRLDDMLAALDQDKNKVFLLNSVTENGWARVIGWDPISVFKYYNGDLKKALKDIEVFTAVQTESERLVIGYTSYDFGCLIHDIDMKSENDLNMPMVVIASFDNWISFNDDGAFINSSDETFINQVYELLKKPRSKIDYYAYRDPLKPTLSKEAYSESYKQIKEYILAGDTYQVNFAHRLEGTTDTNSRQLFRQFSKTCGADFQAYIEIDGFEIISLSPERFIKVQQGIIETSPIKGTRPRGTTDAQDEIIKQELDDNQKDNAELNMITDLMRNDLGAVCDVGSVYVDQERILTAYPTLWHAHSTIKGKLAKDISPIKALCNMMPGGSITGCPKKRTIEIIDQLEPKRRNIYTGSIFTINPKGELDSNIAIRTMVKKQKYLYLSVGGGIVYDSSEDSEYQESLDKSLVFTSSNNTKLLLSSDIIEKQFGSTFIEVLFQDKNRRIICTKTQDDKKIIEISVVEFVESGISQYPKTHQSIINGESMGKAFKKSGIEFYRQTVAAKNITLPVIFNRSFLTSKPATAVSVNIMVGHNKTPYAHITELYSPELIWPERLGHLSDRDLRSIKSIEHYLPKISH